MKRAFLSIVVPLLLIALGFAQTPAAGTNTDQTNIKGCLGGSDGNYTVVEDNTGHIFKITSSSVDLKAHLSHDVTLIGHRTAGASSAATDDAFTITELNMISEQCAAAPAAPAATVTAPAENAAPPAAGATPPAEAAVTPAVDASAPSGSVSTTAETASTPPAAAAVATTSTVEENTITPVAAAVPPAETAVPPAARPRRRSEAHAAAAGAPVRTASPPAETASTPTAATNTPVATSSTSSDPASPADSVTTPRSATSRGWSLWLWIAVAVLVVVVGTLFPFFSRWRKQKSLERTDAPNLSFNREVSSELSKRDKQQTGKAA